MLCCIVLNFEGVYMRFENLTDCFNYVNTLIIYDNGQKLCFDKGDDKFQYITKILSECTLYSHEMPGFGVDGDKTEKEDKNKGIWLELYFGTCCTHNGFDFDSLLFRIEKESFELNIIRRINGKFAGQCFFLSLDNSLKQLYNVIEEILNT